MSVSEQNSAEVPVVGSESAADRSRLSSEVVAAPGALPPRNTDGDGGDVEYCTGFIPLVGRIEDEDNAGDGRAVVLVAGKIKAEADDTPVAADNGGGQKSSTSSTAEGFPLAGNAADGDGCGECPSCFVRLGGGSEGGKSDGAAGGEVVAAAGDLEEVVYHLPGAADRKNAVADKNGGRCSCYADGADCIIENEDCNECPPQCRASTSSEYPLITFVRDGGTAVVMEGKRRERRSSDRNRRSSRKGSGNQGRSCSKSDGRSRSRSRSKSGGRNGGGGSGVSPARAAVTYDDTDAQHRDRRNRRRVRFAGQPDTALNRTTYRETSPAINRQRNRRSKK